MSIVRRTIGLFRERAVLAVVALLLGPLSPFSRLEAQENPEAKKQPPSSIQDQALVVQIETTVDVGPNASAWRSENLRYTVSGTPTSLKLASPTATILVQVTPFDNGKNGIVLVTQGQVWVKESSGSISYRSTLNTVSVHYGDKVYFFPFGRDSDGKAPVRLTIVVLRYRDISASLPDSSDGKNPQNPQNGAAPPSPQAPPAKPAAGSGQQSIDSGSNPGGGKMQAPEPAGGPRKGGM